jgi:hypothetical protein
MENELFKEWIVASASECLGKTNNTFWKVWYDCIKKGLYYDPNYRAFTQYLPSIDLLNKPLWFLYRPVRSNTLESIDTIYNQYKLKIINKETLEGGAVNTLNKEMYLSRRYYNCKLKKVLVLYTGEQPEVISECITEGYKIEEKDINIGFIKAMEYDAVVLNLKKETIYLDEIVPVYPIIFSKNTLLLTPIQIQQINGCDITKPFDSILNRIAQEMGAILLTKERLLDKHSYEKESIIKGVSDNYEGILRDGRVKLAEPNITKHIPLYGHGWLSVDTRTNILGALEVVKPKVIFELGAWFGLSDRLYSNYNPYESFTLYTIDNFNNTAVGNIYGYKISPSDKMFLNHLKYETFCANLSGINDDDNASRFYFDKADSNDKKQVYLMKMDVYEGLELLWKQGVIPDLIFIDFEKKEKPLLDLLYTLKKRYPKAVIVGDDAVAPTVKRTALSVKVPFKRVLKDSYYIAPNKHIFDKLESTIPRIVKETAPSTNQGSVLKDIKKGILKEPFIRVDTQAGVALTEFVRSQKEASKLILEDMIEYPESWSKWPSPITTPGSLTPFDFYSHNIQFDNF